MTIFRDNPVSSVTDIPLYQQLYTHLRAAILTEKLKGGMKLPSTSALADELGVSRNTTLSAYQQLMTEGYLDGVVGSGTFVARVLPDHLLTPPGRKHLTDTQATEARHPLFSDHAKLQLATPRMSAATPSPDGAPPRPFRFGVPDLQAFPYKLWSRLAVRRARNISALPYQDYAGYLPLRESIAAHVTVSRRVHCMPEQIIILPGAQGGINLAHLLLSVKGLR